jgi:tetraacyldisaccharide 4'-kinase
VDVPVVSVGNLTLGGTGKTPMVEWLARWFRDRHVRLTVISRGYGAESGTLNDEAQELRQKLPDVPHLQNPDRVAAALLAVAELQCQLIVLDDAFQHRRIGRDLDLVMLDALEPFGFGHVFPRGTLREPLAGLRRAHVVALSRADMLPPPQREQICRQVQRYAPHCLWLEVAHTARTLVSSTAREEPLSSLSGESVAAFCGVGNPAGFRHTLAACGHQVVAMREFPDHHRYSRADVDWLSDWAERLRVAAVLCTEKDLVKLDIEHLGRRPLWAVRVGLEFLAGREAFEAKLAALLPPPQAP